MTLLRTSYEPKQHTCAIPSFCVVPDLSRCCGIGPVRLRLKKSRFIRTSESCVFGVSEICKSMA